MLSDSIYSEMHVAKIVRRLRKQWMSYGKKFAAIQKAAVRIALPDGRLKTFIRCATCRGLFPRDMIDAHHLVPVGQLESNEESAVEAYKKLMFCKVEGIQPLCKVCHQFQTHKH